MIDQIKVQEDLKKAEERRTFVNNARVQLDSNRRTDDLAQEAAGVSRVTPHLRLGSLAVGGHGSWGNVARDLG
jgi:hypothetical protein